VPELTAIREQVVQSDDSDVTATVRCVTQTMPIPGHEPRHAQTACGLKS
jgi:hypothetical protein